MEGFQITNKINANRYEYLGVKKITYHASNHDLDIFTRWSGTYYYFVSASSCKNEKCDLPDFPYRLFSNDKKKLSMFPLTSDELALINKIRIGKKISEVGKN